MPRNKICSLGNSCPLKNTGSYYILMTLYHGVLFTIITTTHGELDTSNWWWLVLVVVGTGKLFIFFTMENEWGKIRNLHLVILSSLKRTNRIFDVLPAFVIYGGVLSHGIWWLCVCACIRMSFSFQHVMDGRCELGRLLSLYELQIFASLKWE